MRTVPGVEQCVFKANVQSKLRQQEGGLAMQSHKGSLHEANCLAVAWRRLIAVLMRNHVNVNWFRELNVKISIEQNQRACFFNHPGNNPIRLLSAPGTGFPMPFVFQTLSYSIAIYPFAFYA